MTQELKKEGKSFAGSYKRIIEETSDEPIEAINKELQKDYKVLELLDVLDGKKVKGGKLGKYFAQIGGNIVGGAAGSVGGPVGKCRRNNYWWRDCWKNKRTDVEKTPLVNPLVAQ